MAENKDKAKRMPDWRMPAPLGAEGMMDFWNRFFPLRVTNSLTRTKVPFVPKDPEQVLWYMCGPTVYDASHMGHARTYLHFDILRRLMADHFGYNVVLVMNITDIDDKIILRANERGKDFRELAAHFEADFMEDMRALGVRPPEVVTRVSEFIPEVVDYIKGIVDNQYAYESNGSVYFDVQSFHQKKGHVYAKIYPEGVGNGELLAEGEGALSVGSMDKRSPSDFALWKRSKEGEPSWDSPWGPGRPGWHIECSVMASHTFEMFGDGSMDIHSGGVDLRFPHHDNEMAQAEAKYDSQQWVNYFLHTGHLHIKGSKMSKSLKNFITIKEALEEHSARQVRMLFLLHKYNAPMDYSADAMSQALSTEKLFGEFFHNVKAALRRSSPKDSARLGPAELTLNSSTSETKAAVRAALADDFDTPVAMAALQELVREVNKYLEKKEKEGQAAVETVVRGAAEYVTRMFKVFGLTSTGATVGWVGADEAAAGDREEVLGPVLNTLSAFRDKVRGCARAGDAAGVLRECDIVRDEALPLLGVRLEDKGDQVVWKLEDPKVLMLEREQKVQEQLRKDVAKAEAAQKAREKELRAQTPPSDWFKSLKGDDGQPKYTKFAEDGMPTHNAAGEELSKKASKNLAKEWKAQTDMYKTYLESVGGK